MDHLVINVPNRAVRKGETRAMCVGCNTLGPPVKNPSGKSTATPADSKAIIEQYLAWGWRPGLFGPRCVKCSGN